MKKKLLTLGLVLLFCSACEETVTDSTDNGDDGNMNVPKETSKAGDVQKTRNLPTDYFIKDVVAYTWASGTKQATVYSSTCEEVNNKLVWKADNKKEYVVSLFDYPSRDSIEMMIGAASFGMYYDADLRNPFPAGHLYQANETNKNSINGFVIGYDTYTNVGFINTQCLVQNLDITDEIMDFFKIGGGDRITYDCNSVNVAGVDIKLVSHTPTSISYSFFYEGYRCDLTETFRFAYYQEDCEAAYEDFKIDAVADPTLVFDMNDYNYGFETYDLRCIDALFVNAPFFKGESMRKEFVKFLVDMSKKIRK